MTNKKAIKQMIEVMFRCHAREQWTEIFTFSIVLVVVVISAGANTGFRRLRNDTTFIACPDSCDVVDYPEL